MALELPEGHEAYLDDGHIRAAIDDKAVMVDYLMACGEYAYEGSSTPEERAYLADLANRRKANFIAEVGFNTGYSSHTFLRSRPEATVVSFDLGAHTYIQAAKANIDRLFPGRHTLILGDSRKTVPQYLANNTNVRFDLVFIDGGHEYQVARSDILNFRSLSHEGTALVMDDLIPWMHWGEGPFRAWTDLLCEGTISQEELLIDGRHAEKISPPARRIWALGRYATS